MFDNHNAVGCSTTGDGKLSICALLQDAGGYRIVTRDIATGRQINSVPLDIDASFSIGGLSLHPDGTRFATAVGRFNYDLWIMEGIPQPSTGLARLFHHWTQ